jgi:hypothetical protein
MLALSFDKPSYGPKDVRTLTITSDARITLDTVTVDAGPAGKGSGTVQLVAPITITDSTGIVWVLKSDDGKTAVYTYTPPAS